MKAKDRLERVTREAARRPILALTVVAVLALAGGALALGLRPSTGIDTFVGSSSSSYQATQAWHRHFGDDSIVILVRERLTDLVETKDLATLTFLEACLAGREAVADPNLRAFRSAPAGHAVPYGGTRSPCGRLMAAHYVQAVSGPGTFLNQAVISVQQGLASIEAADARKVAAVESAALAVARAEHKSAAVQRQSAKAAGALQQVQNTQTLEQLYLNSGIQGLPTIDNASFVSQIVFDPTRGVNEPKARFAFLFPTQKSALIEVRLRSSLSDAQQAHAISLIRQAVKMSTFRLAYGGTYLVSGAPVVLNDLAATITASVGVLVLAALLVMAAVLLVVFRCRLRLLPLVVALAATGITFGALTLVGGSLTMASIAVLPVLIGLAVDYAIQFQSRIDEAGRQEGASRESAHAAVRRATVAGAPTIATAALATATGFLVLMLSPVPMVRGFGLLLVVGIAAGFACALCVAAAAFVVVDRAGGALGAALRGAADILRDLRWRTRSLLPGRAESALTGAVLSAGSRARRGARRAISASVARPGRVLAVGAILALGGWIADTQTAVQSDVTKLVPSTMPALHDLNTLEKVTGVSGEIDVTVHARDLTQPRVVNWMIAYEQRLLTHYGYVETKGCAHATLCPALSLPDLFSQATKAAGASSVSLTGSGIRSLLAVVPSPFKSAVITPDYRDATVAFGIRLMPLDRQEQVISYMQSQLHPPPGVSASLVGLPVLAAQANGALSSSARRLWMLLAGIAAVGLVLLAVFKDPRRAVVPLIPIALATGWSALILFAIGIPLNPMSATLGALVIAISTEFSVLLAERFRQERAAGHELQPALARTYRSTGAAVIASGVTAIAGFGVLIVSNITMLRDFGLVTLIDLTVSLAGVLFVLPAVVVMSERREAFADLRSAARKVGAGLKRPWRRPRVA